MAHGAAIVRWELLAASSQHLDVICCPLSDNIPAKAWTNSQDDQSRFIGYSTPGFILTSASKRFPSYLTCLLIPLEAERSQRPQHPLLLTRWSSPLPRVLFFSGYNQAMDPKPDITTRQPAPNRSAGNALSCTLPTEPSIGLPSHATPSEEQRTVRPAESSAPPRPDPIPWDGPYEVSGPSETGLMSARFLAFSSPILIQLYKGATTEQQARDALDAVRDACRAYERLFSRFLPHSDISRINAAHGQTVPIDDRTYEVLDKAIGYCDTSEGLFDITIGPAASLWDFLNHRVADPGSLADACSHVGWKGLVLSRDPSTGTALAQLQDPLASIDLGGIGKGWIADRLSEMLDDHGFDGYIVNLGGNVKVGGSKPDGSPWSVGIRDPFHTESLIGSVRITEGSVVTSGIYERCFTHGDTLYHHILDPATGMPVVTDVASASVIARQSVDAEGFSTALVAMGVQRGLAFAARQPQILQAVFIDIHGEIILLYDGIATTEEHSSKTPLPTNR